MDKDFGFILKRAEELGAFRSIIISTDSISVENWVRFKCQFGCGSYGKRLSCPPYSPTPEQTRTIISSYTTALLFQANILKCMEISTLLEKELFLAGYYKAFGLGDGPCFKCGEDESSCALGDGCRFPEQMRPSMEACGINVYKTVRNNGWQIEVVQTRSDETTDIGLALIE